MENVAEWIRSTVEHLLNLQIFWLKYRQTIKKVTQRPKSPSVDQPGPGVQESRPGVVHVLGRGGKGAVIPVPHPTSKILKLKCGRDFSFEF